MRCRSASACGPSTDRGVGEPSMFFAGGMPGLRLGRAAIVTFIALRSSSRLPGGQKRKARAHSHRAPRYESGLLPQPSIGISYRHQSRFVTRRSEEHTSELQSHLNLVCRLLLEKKKQQTPLDYYPNHTTH